MSKTKSGDSSDEFNVPLFEKRLQGLKDTQDSIQTVSAWCLQNRVHHKKIVSSWLNVLKQVKIEHRLTLFHLANDVIQYSKRKNYEFVESWGTTLQKATTMVRDDKIKHKILRIFQIWEQRGIYNDEFLSDLNGLLSISTSKSKQAKEIASSRETREVRDTDKTIDLDDFQTSTLVNNIRDCVRLEGETDKNIKTLSKSQINELESIKMQVKDREHMEDLEKEIAESTKKIDLVIKCLLGESKVRKVLITAIEQAEAFYSNQRGDVKVVANAYRNFGNRIKNMKKKLEELQPTLPSPIPSPDINAPSPEPDNDFILPDEQVNYFNQQPPIMNSYIGTELPFDINDFNSESSQSHYDNGSSAQPIQVINSRTGPKEESGFNLQDFFKSYLDSYTPSIQSQSTPQPVPVPNPYPPPNLYQPPPSIPNPLVPNYAPPMENIPPYQPASYTNQPSILPPLQPPPMPPSLNHSEAYNPAAWDDANLNWNSSQDSNNFEDLVETPVSPPHFERKGVNTNVIEYVDQDNNMPNSADHDIDHRQINLPNMNDIILAVNSVKSNRILDVDHRNLISLTGSPITKILDDPIPPPPTPPIMWSGVDMDFRQQMHVPPPSIVPPVSSDGNMKIDQDYRIPPPNMHPPPLSSAPLEPPPLSDFLKNSLADSDLESPTKNQQRSNKMSNSKTGRDNNESVDMEMSDEDDDPDYNWSPDQSIQVHHQSMAQPPNANNNNNNNSGGGGGGPSIGINHSIINSNNSMRSPLVNQVRSPMLPQQQKFMQPPPFSKWPNHNNSKPPLNNSMDHRGGGGGGDGNLPPSPQPGGYYPSPRGGLPFYPMPRGSPFSPGGGGGGGMNNFRGNNNNRGSPYFRPRGGHMGGGGMPPGGHNGNDGAIRFNNGGGFRGKFRGNMKRGGLW